MATASTFVRLKFKDFDTFKKVFDEYRAKAVKAGAGRESIHRPKDDPKTVMVFRQWSSIKEAEAYYTSPELKAGFERGGVVESRIEYYEDL